MPISNDYARVPCSSITIPPDRQRRKVQITNGFAESIAKQGVLVPIIITRELTLVAGERRLTASLAAGLPDIPVRFVDEVSPEELQIVELEENLKREDLHWTDQVRAICKLHKAYASRSPGWTEGQTAEEISLSFGHLNKLLRLGDYLTHPKVAEQPTFSTAMAVLDRIVTRKSQEAMNDLLSISSNAISSAIAAGGAPPATGAPLDLDLVSQSATTSRNKVMEVIRAAEGKVRGEQSPSSGGLPDNILLGDFTTWASTYTGPKFNFLHCDFPYGVGLFDGNRLLADTAYSDTKDVYFNLIESLCANLDKILTSNAHVMFWFSMEYYARTLDMFRRLAPDLVFFRHPLVWVKSDNAGLLVDRNRGPRRIYETALMGIRGDRFVAKAVSNAYSAPTERSLHPSAKPEPVLKHFFQMFVDSGTSMLDPTCGAGSALRAAEELGALRTFGIEQSPEFHSAAVNALARSRSLRKAAAQQAKSE